jgi:hypothetical protein
MKPWESDSRGVAGHVTTLLKLWEHTMRRRRSLSKARRGLRLHAGICSRNQPCHSQAAALRRPTRGPSRSQSRGKAGVTRHSNASRTRQSAAGCHAQTPGSPPRKTQRASHAISRPRLTQILIACTERHTLLLRVSSHDALQTKCRRAFDNANVQ